MNRAIKRLIYGTFYLVVIGGIGTLVSLTLLRPAASCFDTKQNQDEEGVDCGGVCSPVCFSADFQNIRVQSVQLFSPVSSTLIVLTKMQNPNPSLAARSFTYTIALGKDSSIVKSIPENGFAYAGEVKYFADFIEGLDRRSIDQAGVTISDVVWAKAAEMPKPDLVVSDRQTTADVNSVEVTGHLANRDTVPIPQAKIIALFYSATGILLDVSATELDDIRTGDARAFAITHPPISDLAPERTELIVSAKR